MYTSEDNVLMGVYAYQKIECKTAVISRMLSSHGVVETIFCSVTHVWYLSFLYIQLCIRINSDKPNVTRRPDYLNDHYRCVYLREVLHKMRLL